jgi:YD repeat-containing protein
MSITTTTGRTITVELVNDGTGLTDVIELVDEAGIAWRLDRDAAEQLIAELSRVLAS